MGFLKFLKKGEEKRQEKEVLSDELELPPPPQMGSFSAGLPSFAGPKLEAPTQMHKLDIPTAIINKPSEIGEELTRLPDIQNFDFPQETMSLTETVPVPQPPKMPAFQEIFLKPQMPVKPIEQQPSKVEIVDGPVFVKGHQFRRIVEDIDSILKSQKIIEAEVLKLRHLKDEEYEKWSRCLEDTQRRLMFIDKNLFEV